MNYGLTFSQFNTILNDEVDKIKKTCRDQGVSPIAISLAKHSCKKIYYNELLDNDDVDWNMIFILCFWISLKFIEDEIFTLDWIKHDLEQAYPNKLLLYNEWVILYILDFDIGFYKLFPEGKIDHNCSSQPL